MKRSAMTDMISGLMRRTFLLAVIVLCSVQAQSDAASPRIGVLSPGTPETLAQSPVLAGLRQGLREHGYVEGTNIAIEYRFARGQFDDTFVDAAPGRPGNRVRGLTLRSTGRARHAASTWRASAAG